METVNNLGQYIVHVTRLRDLIGGTREVFFSKMEETHGT